MDERKIIDKSLKIAKKLFNIKGPLEWFYDDMLTIESNIQMRFIDSETLNSNENLIGVSTNLRKMCPFKEDLIFPYWIMSKIFHEVWHCHQYESDKTVFMNYKNISLSNSSDDYLTQNIELEAYAIENLILCYFISPEIKLLYNYNNEELASKILSLEKNFDKKFHNDFFRLIEEN